MPNPLFILVIIGAGFLKQPILGPMIAAAVWLSGMWLMLVTALLIPSSRSSAAADLTAGRRPNMIERAAHAMQLGREQDGRSFGKVLGDAVSVSVQKLMVIGGFMIFASVVAKLSEPLLAPLLHTFGLSFITPALFESHLGAYASAVWDAPGVSLLPNAAIIAAVLAWGGLSGILQAGYAISGTDIKLLPFIGLRCIHALHAFAFMLLLWKPIHYLLGLWSASGTAPAIVLSGQFSKEAETAAMTAIIRAGDLPALWPYSAAACAALALVLILVAAVLRFFKQAPRSFIK
ncbi:Sporulation integral membrane protein YlbJ [compost metagenome]